MTSASSYITSASCYHPRYQSRFSMYIRGLIPRNFAELADVVPIGMINQGISVLKILISGGTVGNLVLRRRANINKT